MRKIRLFRLIVTAIPVFLAVSIFAQEEFILDPAQLIPADTGYYIGGVYKDKDEDGIDEFYNGCIDEYGDASHNESDTQQDFIYHRCMIMPTCYPKDAVADPSVAEIDHAEGYIELTKTKYVGTDSAVMGYLISPAVSNLVSLTMETSPDVSSNDSRHIYYLIEYSIDNGTTWEATYIQDETISKKGDEHVYDNANSDFKKIITASTEGPVVLRIMTKPQIQIGEDIEYASQRLKVHYLKIVADKAISVRNSYTDKSEIKVINRVIYSENSPVEVFNTLGQFVGSGTILTVQPGIYIVRSENGSTQKIYVR